MDKRIDIVGMQLFKGVHHYHEHTGILGETHHYPWGIDRNDKRFCRLHPVILTILLSDTKQKTDYLFRDRTTSQSMRLSKYGANVVQIDFNNILIC